MKDLISGEKKHIKADNIKHLAVPQYESLSVKQIKKFIAEHPEGLLYLPEEQEWEKLPKQWLCNVIHTVVDEQFAVWVKQRIKERNSGIVKQK